MDSIVNKKKVIEQRDISQLRLHEGTMRMSPPSRNLRKLKSKKRSSVWIGEDECTPLRKGDVAQH
jgi:hypothetical protein